MKYVRKDKKKYGIWAELEYLGLKCKTCGDKLVFDFKIDRVRMLKGGCEKCSTEQMKLFDNAKTLRRRK